MELLELLGDCFLASTDTALHLFWMNLLFYICQAFCFDVYIQISVTVYQISFPGIGSEN